LLQFWILAVDYPPGEVSFLQINRRHVAPRWLDRRVAFGIEEPDPLLDLVRIAFAGRLFDSESIRILVRVHEKPVSLWIEAAAAPKHSASEPRMHDRPLLGRWRINSAGAGIPPDLLHRVMRLGRPVGDFVLGECVPDQRRRLHRERLRRPQLFAGNVRGRYGTFFDRKNRLARRTLEEEHQTHLGNLSDGLYGAAASPDRDESWLAWRIVVP